MKNQDIENLIRIFGNSDIQTVEDAISYLKHVLLASGETENRKPLIMVDDSDDHCFAVKCCNLINDGYRIQSSSCGYSELQNFNYFMAIFVDKNLDK